MEAIAEITANVPSAVPESRTLRQKVAGVRSRQIAVSSAIGLSFMVALAAAVLTAGLLLDWWFELALWLRTLILLGHLGALAGLLFVFVLRPLIHRPDDDAVALLIEKGKPEFRTRMIAAIQLARPGGLPAGASVALARALVADTESLAAGMDVREVIPLGPCKRHARNALILLALALVAFGYTREISEVLLKRAFLAELDVPRKTRVDVLNGDKLIGRGDDVTIMARVRGYNPGKGELSIYHESGHKEEIPLVADGQDPRKFVRVIENIQGSFSYRIRVFDGTSPRYKVEAVPRPEVAFLECSQVYPAYTGLGTVRRALGDLALLAGSKLQIKATATKPISRASVRLVGLDDEIPMEIDPKDSRQLSATVPIPVRDLDGVSFHLADLHGVKSLDPTVYRVDILLDKPPVARIVFPERREDLATPAATLLIGFEASDDYAIGKALLRYKIDSLDQGAERSFELDLGNEAPKSLRRRIEWKLRDLPSLPAIGSIVEYWIEVVDTNDETGPGSGSTEHFIARVVTEEEKRADLMNRVSDYLGGIDDVASDQEKLNQSLGAIIRLKPQ